MQEKFRRGSNRRRLGEVPEGEVMRSLFLIMRYMFPIMGSYRITDIFRSSCQHSVIQFVMLGLCHFEVWFDILPLVI